MIEDIMTSIINYYNNKLLLMIQKVINRGINILIVYYKSIT